jgi:hypothetical protein
LRGVYASGPAERAPGRAARSPRLQLGSNRGSRRQPGHHSRASGRPPRAIHFDRAKGYAAAKLRLGTASQDPATRLHSSAAPDSWP